MTPFVTSSSAVLEWFIDGSHCQTHIHFGHLDVIHIVVMVSRLGGNIGNQLEIATQVLEETERFIDNQFGLLRSSRSQEVHLSVSYFGEMFNFEPIEGNKLTNHFRLAKARISSRSL